MAVLGSNTLNHSANLLIQNAGNTKLTVTTTGITVAGTMAATAGTFGTNGTGARTVQSGGSASGGANGDIYLIF
jgi:hypothetical protein